MKKGKFLIVVMATVLVSVLAGYSLCNAGPISKKETYVLGNTGCSLVITTSLFDGSITKAEVTGATCPTPPKGLVAPTLISETIICPDSTQPTTNCQPLAFVDTNIMVKTGANSTYYYYNTAGERIKVTTP